MNYIFDTDEFLEHFGVKGMHWGSRKSETQKTSTTKTPKDNSKYKKIALAVGTGLVSAGVLYLMHKNKSLKSISPVSTNSGKTHVIKLLDKNGKAKIRTVSDEQAKYIQTLIKNHNKTLKNINPDVAAITPDSLLAAHEKSKEEFDRWLTLKERDLWYIYKGPK